MSKTFSHVFIVCVYAFCIHAYVPQQTVEVKGQFAGINSLLPHCESQCQTWLDFQAWWP